MPFPWWFLTVCLLERILSVEKWHLWIVVSDLLARVFRRLFLLVRRCRRQNKLQAGQPQTHLQLLQDASRNTLLWSCFCRMATFPIRIAHRSYFHDLLHDLS